MCRVEVRHTLSKERFEYPFVDCRGGLKLNQINSDLVLGSIATLWESA